MTRKQTSMTTHEKGVSVYLTAAEVQALGDAGGYLSNLIKQCSVLPDDLSNASNGLHSIHCKALKAQGKAGRGDTVSPHCPHSVERVETLDAEQNQISRKKVRFTALLAGLPFLVLGTLLYFFAGGQDPHGLGMSFMILGALSALLFYAIPGIPESFKKLFANSL